MVGVTIPRQTHLGSIGEPAKPAEGAGQEAALLHGLCFSSCLQVPTRLPSGMACDLEVSDEVNPFFPKLLLFMVFILAIESKLEQPSFLFAVVTGKRCLCVAHILLFLHGALHTLTGTACCTAQNS